MDLGSIPSAPTNDADYNCYLNELIPMKLEFQPRKHCDTDPAETDGVAVAYLSYGEFGSYEVRFSDENRLGHWATGLDLTRATAELEEEMDVLVCPIPDVASDSDTPVTGVDVQHARFDAPGSDYTNAEVRLEYSTGEVTEYIGMYIAGVAADTPIPEKHRTRVHGATTQPSVPDELK